MVHFTRRKFLKSTSAAAGVAATGPMIWVKDAQAQCQGRPADTIEGLKNYLYIVMPMRL